MIINFVSLFDMIMKCTIDFSTWFAKKTKKAEIISSPSGLPQTDLLGRLDPIRIFVYQIGEGGTRPAASVENNSGVILCEKGFKVKRGCQNNEQ